MKGRDILAKSKKKPSLFYRSLEDGSLFSMTGLQHTISLIHLMRNLVPSSWHSPSSSCRTWVSEISR